MKVYVLSQLDDYDRSEVLGVFASPDAAKRSAEEAEPGRSFDWSQSDDRLFAPDRAFGGPVYSYFVETFEVTP